MHDNAITLEGLKKLSDTEKLFNPLIRSAVDRLTLLSDKWHSLISNAQNSENVSEDEIDKIIDTLKEFLNARLQGWQLFPKLYLRGGNILLKSLSRVATFPEIIFTRWQHDIQT